MAHVLPLVSTLVKVSSFNKLTETKLAIREPNQKFLAQSQKVESLLWRVWRAPILTDMGASWGYSYDPIIAVPKIIASGF